MPSEPRRKAVPRYSRVLLKISGEALMGRREYGLDWDTVNGIAKDIQAVHALGIEICVVIGGGNIFRGIQGSVAGMERSGADYIGMLATVMNSLALQNALEKLAVPTRVLSAIPMQSVCEPYIRRRALRHLEKGRVVIFAAGTGNPFFTTDTAAALRAAEIHAEIILMAKNGVEGVYSADPALDPTAEFIPEITHMEALERRLRVMDSTALALCMENGMPLNVFNMDDEASLAQIISGVRVGTLVTTAGGDDDGH
jgi:uridylate kinase